MQSALFTKNVLQTRNLPKCCTVNKSGDHGDRAAAKTHHLQGQGGAGTCPWCDWARAGNAPVSTLKYTIHYTRSVSNQPHRVGIWDVPEENLHGK